MTRSSAAAFAALGCLTLTNCGQADADAAGPQVAEQAGLPGPLAEPPIPTGSLTIQQELAATLFNVCLPASRGGSPLAAGSPIMRALGDPQVETSDETGQMMSTFKTPRGLTVYVVPVTGHCEINSAEADLPDDVDLFTALDPITTGWARLGAGELASPDLRFSIVEDVASGSATFNRYTAAPDVAKAHLEARAANDALAYPEALFLATATCSRFKAILALNDGPPDVGGFPELSDRGYWTAVGREPTLEMTGGSLTASETGCEFLTTWDNTDAAQEAEAKGNIDQARAALSGPTSGWRMTRANAWSNDKVDLTLEEDDGMTRYSMTPKA